MNNKDINILDSDRNLLKILLNMYDIKPRKNFLLADRETGEIKLDRYFYFDENYFLTERDREKYPDPDITFILTQFIMGKLGVVDQKEWKDNKPDYLQPYYYIEQHDKKYIYKYRVNLNSFLDKANMLIGNYFSDKNSLNDRAQQVAVKLDTLKLKVEYNI